MWRELAVERELKYAQKWENRKSKMESMVKPLKKRNSRAVKLLGGQSVRFLENNAKCNARLALKGVKYTSESSELLFYDTKKGVKDVKHFIVKQRRNNGKEVI